MTALAEPLLLLDAAVDEVAAVTREHARATDDAAAFPVAALDAMRRTGLLGLLVPRSHGGRGGDLRDLVAVSERIAREDMSAAMIFAMHCQQVAAVVSHAGPALRESLLPRIACGEVYLASVTTERGKGGHLLTSDSALDTAGDRLVIDRDAPIVTGGEHADGFLITMRAPGATSPTQVSLVYADRADLDVTTTGSWNPLGMRASHSLPVRLTGTVPGHHVVGAHGGFHALTVQVFAPLAHIGWSACWLGAATGALSRVVTKLRSPAGRKSADLGSELLLSRLGRVRNRLELVAASLHQCVALVSGGGDLSVPSAQLRLNALKIEAAEQCFAAVNDLVELTGLRDGYLRDSPLRLERTLRDLRSASLNYSNDRLLLANGRLALLDPEVHLGWA
ncbi:acyl-CoA dehydrogenase family protein [Streptomyces olivaceus]|uniref:acyl-CoA dehydrogenase family protein n=1 Tax=Streptomyces olivaceus TaxID=47716 RepID=UPI00364004F3